MQGGAEASRLKPLPQFPTPYSLLPTPYSLLPTPYSLLPTPYSQFNRHRAVVGRVLILDDAVGEFGE